MTWRNLFRRKSDKGKTGKKIRNISKRKLIRMRRRKARRRERKEMKEITKLATTMATYGIKETKDLFSLVGATVTAVEASLEDGKINLIDLGNFVTALAALPAAITGIQEIPKEITDLDDDEIEQLRNEFGDVVNNPKWVRAFGAAVLFYDAIYEIVKKDEAQA